MGRIATRWFARMQAPDTGATARASLDRWLALDPAHRREFQRREAIWELLGTLRDDQETQQLVNETLAQTVADRATAARRWSRKKLVSSVCAAIAVLGIGAGLWRAGLFGPGADTVTYQQVHQTRLGQQRTIDLPDGSVIVMNTSTRIEVRFTKRARAIDLMQGEAIFSVHPDRERPFDVVSGSARTRAIGTRFNVLRLEDRSEVAVVEGRVKVTSAMAKSADSGTELGAGRAVTLDRTGAFEPVRAADLNRIEAWQSGRVEFHNTALWSAVQDFNRYSAVPIHVEDPGLRDMRVTGIFHIGDVEAFQKTLNSLFGIRSERRSQGIYLSPPPAAAPPAGR